jgi:hypothetical protein
MKLRIGYSVRMIAVAMIGFVPFGLGANQNTPDDECAQTAHMQIYSNAVFVEEAGDVVGYELAFQQRKGNSIEALLFDYQAVPTKEGMSISCRISGKELTMQGNWVVHLIEEPSKNEILETRPVEISGTLNSKHFRGTITISGQAEPVTLKAQRPYLDVQTLGRLRPNGINQQSGRTTPSFRFADLPGSITVRRQITSELPVPPETA